MAYSAPLIYRTAAYFITLDGNQGGFLTMLSYIYIWPSCSCGPGDATLVGYCRHWLSGVATRSRHRLFGGSATAHLAHNCVTHSRGYLSGLDSLAELWDPICDLISPRDEPLNCCVVEWDEGRGPLEFGLDEPSYQSIIVLIFEIFIVVHF